MILTKIRMISQQNWGHTESFTATSEKWDFKNLHETDMLQDIETNA